MADGSVLPFQPRRAPVKALDAWDAWAGALRGEVSPNTWTQYTTRVLRFLALTRLANQPVQSITRTDILTFFGDHCPRGHAKVMHVAGLRRFTHWAVLEGLIDRDQDPMLEVTAKAPRPRDPLSLTDDELRRLVASLDRLRGRHAALSVLLGYLMALRRMELAGLRWTDILDADGGLAAVLTDTKGGHPRRVPVSPAALAVLNELRAIGRPRYRRAARADFIVGVKRGTISDWVHMAALHAGIPIQKAHSHILRTSAATHMLRGGANVVVVQKLLGHAKLTTTYRYLEATDVEKRVGVGLLRAPAGFGRVD